MVTRVAAMSRLALANIVIRSFRIIRPAVEQQAEAAGEDQDAHQDRAGRRRAAPGLTRSSDCVQRLQHEKR
ncbi:hypothetical protein Plo01_31310 [Planobispora longispora]|uniref:Uncharacterized protein n=1 Tax=Planobispora longispora TaxID=28887 RepID=A0A8J3RJ81_9ACTN|nr:hypothetical protein Plo01_31310 [Planobispora longispora]